MRKSRILVCALLFYSQASYLWSKDLSIQEQEWFQLVEKGSSRSLARFLKKNGKFNISSEDEKGFSAIHLSAVKGTYKIAKFLLAEDRYCLSYRDKEGNTPLHLAATHKHKKILKLFLGHLKSIEKSFFESEDSPLEMLNAKGESPIFSAVRTGDRKIVELFQEYGANMEVVNDLGETLLHQAIISRDLELVAFLLEQGADVNALNEESVSPLWLATSLGEVQMAKGLMLYGAKNDALLAPYLALYKNEDKDQVPDPVLWEILLSKKATLEGSKAMIKLSRKWVDDQWRNLYVRRVFEIPLEKHQEKIREFNKFSRMKLEDLAQLDLPYEDD